MTIIRPWKPADSEALVPLITQYRVTESRFHGRAQSPDVGAAEVEVGSFADPIIRVFVAEDEEQGPVGYVVCSLKDGEVWVDSLFVLPIFRRQGIGSALFIQAEHLAEELGLGSVHNRVQPNNDRMIGLLRKRGYNMLSMIEIRKSRQDEEHLRKINVGMNIFEYCC